MTPEERKSASKFLSLVLRHNPGAAGVKLDQNGFVDVQDLLVGCAAKGRRISRADLDEIVKTNDKQRFSFDQTGTRIRANQGHSVDVDLELPPTTPPDTLYHGTAAESVARIFSHGGLRPMSRNHVHLSLDEETARRVGARHGKPVILKVDAKKMTEDGYEFFVSANGVWLTTTVPAQYLEILT